METRALPGKREEEYRAGITPRIRCGTIEYSIKYGIREALLERYKRGNSGALVLGMSCYNRVRLRAIMRSFFTIALLGISLLPLTAEDPLEKRADKQAPTISIQPRTRTSPAVGGETILDRRADLRIDTTPVSYTHLTLPTILRV